MNEANIKNNNTEKGIKVKSLIPCIYAYPYNERLGYPQKNTCVGVFRSIDCFDFPSYGRNFAALVIMDVLKGSYSININIVDEKENKIIKDVNTKIDEPNDMGANIYIPFQNVTFPKAGKYFFQLSIDDNIIYTYDFMVAKISMPVYTDEEKKNILDDPYTIKISKGELVHDCGHIKKFSITLDPAKQNKEEKLPEEDIIRCEKCGKEINIVEMKAELNFFLGTKDVIDTFNRNLFKSRRLAENGFLEESLVFQITAFETFMKDHFEQSYKNWFNYLFDQQKDDNNVKEIKNEMNKVIKDMNINKAFLDKILMSEINHSGFGEIDDYNKILKELLFGDDKNPRVLKEISFQQLTKELGCNWAYKHFFGIEIDRRLDDEKCQNWEHLQECFKKRHRIIHSSKFSYDVSSDLIKKNENIILFVRKLVKDHLEDIKNVRSSIVNK